MPRDGRRCRFDPWSTAARSPRSAQSPRRSSSSRTFPRARYSARARRRSTLDNRASPAGIHRHRSGALRERGHLEAASSRDGTRFLQPGPALLEASGLSASPHTHASERRSRTASSIEQVDIAPTAHRSASATPWSPRTASSRALTNADEQVDSSRRIHAAVHAAEQGDIHDAERRRRSRAGGRARRSTSASSGLAVLRGGDRAASARGEPALATWNIRELGKASDCRKACR